MEFLTVLDAIVIGIYFCILVFIGILLSKKASNSLEDYFLGGHKLPWWAMGISGMASWLDVAGTMVIVSFLFMLGPRGLFIEFRGGVVLILVFMLLWTGKWHYRSKCMTGAEWMEYRFGTGWGGQFARIVMAISAIIGTVGMLAYMIVGVGLFLSMFLPFPPLQCSILLIGIATLYTMASGFYGVVITDVFQSFIIILAVCIISIMAITKISSVSELSLLAQEITGNSQWMSSAMHWHTEMPKGYEAYQHLMLFAMFYLLRNVLGGMGAGADPKYFGARNERECGTMSFLWGCVMTFRWPLMISFAVLGLYLVKDLFPDLNVIVQSSNLIKTQFPGISQEHWSATLSGIVNSPEQYQPDFIIGLKNLLKDNWNTKLSMISFEGTINPEKIVPAVILMTIPTGLRGLIIVALIAASMSTFDSTVNTTTGFFTRDIYQRYLRPKAKNRELIISSYGFILVLVGFAFLMAYQIKSINDIWGWIVMGLGGGLAVPAMLKFYWWRFNGGGFAIGTLTGLTGALVQRAFFPDLVEWQQFSILMLFGLAGSIIGTYLTKPTDEKIVTHFYETTRPFGVWKPYMDKLPTDVREKTNREHRNDLIAVPFTLLWQVTMFLMPMQLIIRSWSSFSITFVLFLIGLTGMYFFWYRNLPITNRIN